MDNVSTTVQVKDPVLPVKAKHWTIREEETAISHRKLLGRGGFGEVHELSNAETGKAFARKVIRELGFVTKDDVDNEVRALKKLCQNQHPNIVQVFEYGQLNPESTIHFIDMELCDISLGNYLLGQELKNVVNWATVREQGDTPTHTYKILQQILNGLVYIHCLDEVHRDLSPQNVLFRDSVWKIADFGLTSTGTSSRLVTTSAGRGKECYRAPELLQQPQKSGHYNNKSDMWSFGCIAFELFTGGKAFRSDFQTYEYGGNNRSPKMYFKGLDDLTKHYISGLLEVDPDKRPSARTLLKEKFLTETPSADSSEAARAQKRRRSTTSGTAPPSDSATSTLLKLTLDWAVSNRSLSLILVLVEAGLKPVNPVQAYCILKAFHVDWNDSSCSHLRKLINLYPPSFWQTIIPGFVSKFLDANIIEVDDFLGFPSESESPDMHFVSDTSWSMSPISRFGGEDWDVICTDRFSDISNVHTYHWVSASREFHDEVQISVDESGSYFAVWISGWAKLYNVNLGSDGKTLSLDALSGLPTLKHISCVRFTHNSAHLVVGYMGTFRAVCVWDLATREKVLQLEPTTYQISAIDISRDDTRLVGIGANGYTIWNLETGKTIDSSSRGFRSESLNSIALSTDGEFVLSKSSQYGYARVLDESWDIRLIGHQRNLTSIACSPTNPRQVLTGAQDQTVRLWTIPSKEVLRATFEQFDGHTYVLPYPRCTTFTGHEESVSTVAFSPDARWIASGCRDGSVRLWDPKNGALALLLQEHRGTQVTSVAFLPSPLGSLLAVAYNDGTLRMWNYSNDFEAAEG